MQARGVRSTFLAGEIAKRGDVGGRRRPASLGKEADRISGEADRIGGGDETTANPLFQGQPPGLREADMGGSEIMLTIPVSDRKSIRATGRPWPFTLSR